MEVTKPKGWYYIGDLFFVIDDDNYDETEFLTKTLNDTFEDNYDNEYSVNSNTIGCVRVEDISIDKLKNINYGYLHYFENDFVCSGKNGIIKFGHIKINTGIIPDIEYDNDTNVSEEEKLKKLCEQGDSKKINARIGWDIDLCEQVLFYACKNGKFKIVEIILKKYGQFCRELDIQHALELACENGDIDIIKSIVDKMDIYYDIFVNALRSASNFNNAHVIRYLTDKYMEYGWDINDMLDNAIIENNKKLVDYLIEEGITDFDRGMEIASISGNVEMVKYMIELGALNWYICLYSVSEFYYECKNKNECMCGGIECRTKAFDIMKLLFINGAVIDMDDYYNYYDNKYRPHFCIQFDCLYEMTTVKQYKQRLENIRNLERLELSDDINSVICGYF